MRGNEPAADSPIPVTVVDTRSVAMAMGFAELQSERLLARGIDIRGHGLSHLAVRVPDWGMYVHQRMLLERHASSNSENLWNGRPISLIVLAEPLDVLDGAHVPVIELIPPVHQRVYRMGLEHLGVVIGDAVDDFARTHRAAHGSAVPEP